MTMGTTSEYLESFRDQLNRYMWRTTRGRMCYTFRMEPKSKRAMTTREKVEFQRALLDQMRTRRRRSYRGKIAAELTIAPAKQNPPYIHTATKNLLDLCRQPLTESGIRRKALAYEDDRQIAYLSVKYRLDDRTEPRITASFYPLRYFLADVALARAILDGDFDDDAGFDRDALDDILEDLGEDRQGEDPDERAQEYMDEYADLLRSRDCFVSILGEEAYRTAAMASQALAQEAVLSRSRMSIQDLYYLYSASGTTVAAPLSELVTRPPIKIRLPGVPVHEGGTEKLKQEVRKALIEHRASHSLLNPLHIPVAVELLYKPPAQPGFYKDLDNTMSLVLAVFHEVFKPPTTFLPGVARSDDGLGGLFWRSPSVPCCATRCEIVEIPRHGSDAADGFLALGITSDSPGSDSVWARVSDLLYQVGDAHNLGL